MKILEYSAQNDKLLPSETGYEAQVRSGRLLNELYRQQVSDVEQGGRVQGEEIRGETWPLEFDRFRQAGGVRISFRGGDGGRERGGSTRYAGPHGYREASDGAPHLARVAREAVNHPLKPMANPMLDEMNAIDKAANDWYYGQAAKGSMDPSGGFGSGQDYSGEGEGITSAGPNLGEGKDVADTAPPQQNDSFVQQGEQAVGNFFDKIASWF